MRQCQCTHARTKHRKGRCTGKFGDLPCSCTGFVQLVNPMPPASSSATLEKPGENVKNEPCSSTGDPEKPGENVVPWHEVAAALQISPEKPLPDAIQLPSGQVMRPTHYSAEFGPRTVPSNGCTHPAKRNFGLRNEGSLRFEWCLRCGALRYLQAGIWGAWECPVGLQPRPAPRFGGGMYSIEGDSFIHGIEGGDGDEW